MYSQCLNLLFLSQLSVNNLLVCIARSWLALMVAFYFQTVEGVEGTSWLVDSFSCVSVLFFYILLRQNRIWKRSLCSIGVSSYRAFVYIQTNRNYLVFNWFFVQMAQSIERLISYKQNVLGVYCHRSRSMFLNSRNACRRSSRSNLLGYVDCAY